MDVREHGFERGDVGDVCGEVIFEVIIESFHGDGEGCGVCLNRRKPCMNEGLVKPREFVDVPSGRMGKRQEPVIEIEVSGGRDKAYRKAMGDWE